jgi:YfiH family protein
LPAETPGSFEVLEPLTLWRPEVGESWLHLRVTTRLGGISPPPYDALNLSQATGDRQQHVESNIALLKRRLGLEEVPWHRLRQVHGDRVLPAGEEAFPEADGLWTQRPGEVLVVGVADCVPVFLWDARQRRIALVHAGWRGTAAGIVARGVECLCGAGSSPQDLWMAMGPSIGPCCYEVGPDVSRALPEACESTREGTLQGDLRRANRLRAAACGIPSKQILPDPPCTGCDAERFFSHRKLGPRTGRQWALAWMQA